jgi:transcriptional regulator with XRE-family HTH domain
MRIVLQPDRLRTLMEKRGLSQSELARRVGVAQATIYKLVSGMSYSSRHLHLIARELQTTPDYLIGAIDDPDLSASPVLPAPTPTHVMMAVQLPSTDALAEMFEALLAGISPDVDPRLRAEQSLLLAQRLPIGLSQLQGARRVVRRPVRDRQRAKVVASASMSPDELQR